MYTREHALTIAKAYNSHTCKRFFLNISNARAWATSSGSSAAGAGAGCEGDECVGLVAGAGVGCEGDEGVGFERRGSECEGSVAAGVLAGGDVRAIFVPGEENKWINNNSKYCVVHAYMCACCESKWTWLCMCVFVYVCVRVCVCVFEWLRVLCVTCGAQRTLFVIVVVIDEHHLVSARWSACGGGPCKKINKWKQNQIYMHTPHTASTTFNGVNWVFTLSWEKQKGCSCCAPY